MIPVRVRSDITPVLASERRVNIQRGHPQYDQPCPVCTKRLGSDPTVYVLIGVDPEDRKPEPGQWTTGVAIMVHAVCAGVSRAAHIHVDDGTVEGCPGCFEEPA